MCKKRMELLQFMVGELLSPTKTLTLEMLNSQKL